MTRHIQKLLMLLLVFLSQFIYSQTYPVQAVPTVVSPYSSKLSDYSNAMFNRINLQLITTDLLVQNRPAQLHLKIQGNGITAQSAPILSGIQPIYLNGGEILSLTSADLAGYFRYQNLQGLTTTQYSEALPDGVYTICFQVYDVVTKKWLSQNSCATVYLMLNDPPQLNLPSNNEQIPSTEFPNIIFSWTPRHMNATNVSYDYELKEILNPNLDPAFAFEVSPLLHKEEGVRTTTLLYDISKPTLIPGKRYAWRVKAISTSGLAENSVFKNNGFSQIHSFTYSSNCDAPKYLLSEQQSQSRVKLMWQSENTHKKYHVQYRKANVENAEWFEVYTVNTQTILQDLEAGFTYEFRVGATCDATQFGTTQSYVYSGIQTFEIDKDENATAYNCGIVPDIEVTNQQPLGAMVINETFMAGDFPVKVLSVQGSSGVFTGTGYIQVPYLFDTRIGVVFDNIRINSDYQLVDGMVETTYDPEWGNVDYINDLVEVNQQDVKVDFPIDTIEVRNGEIIVTGPNGQTETFPGGKDTVITDSTGNSYYVDADGNVSGPHKQAPGGKPTPENTDGVDKNGEVTSLTASGIRVTFEQHSTSKYAYDKVAYKKALTKEYKEVSGEFVPFKAVPNGIEELFVAKVAIADNNIKADSLVFRTQNGIKINAERIGTTNDFVLKLKGAQKFAWEEVQAAIKQGDKYKVAGVFNFVHISPKTINLKLVPTSSTVNVSNKIAEIKAIYNQLAIDVQIDVEEPFDIATYLVNDKLPTEDHLGDLSTYSPAQNAIIDAFTKAPGRTMQQAYYLFVTDKEASNGQDGYMRLNNQFGFIFSNTVHTIAHELGHGAFKLQHPFKQFKNKGVDKNATQGLMDYAGGTDLLFTDWKQINDPAFKLYAFQGQSDGEFKEFHLTPDWTVFKYSTSSTYASMDGVVRIPNGAVHGISKDDVIYNWISKDNAYVDKNGNKLPDVIIYKNEDIKDDTVIGLFWIRGKCGYNESYSTNWGYIKDKKENFNIDDIKDKNAPIKYLGKVPCIVDETGIESGSVRYEDKCIGKSIAEKNQERIEIETIFSEPSVDKKALAEKINTVDICSLRTLSYDKVKAMIILFSEESSYSNEVQEAIVKLMNCIREDNVKDYYSNVLSKDGNRVLKKQLSNISAKKYLFFTNGNYNYYLETLAYLTSKLSVDSDKWNVVNTIIKEKYDELEESEDVTFETILSSVNSLEYKDKIPGAIKWFRKMLIEDVESLSDFKIVLDIAVMRLDNKESFSSFTQGDLYTIKVRATNGLDVNCGPKDDSQWSWTKPVPFNQNCETNDQYVIDNYSGYISEEKLKQTFAWSKYLGENPSVNNLFTSNLVKYLEAFKTQFELFDESFQLQNQKYWNDNDVTCGNLNDYINHINTAETSESLGNVSKDKRITFVNQFFTCDNPVGGSMSLDDSETALLKILTSFSSSEKEILTTIESIGIKKIYDVLSGSHLSKVLMWIGGQCANSGNYTPLKNSDILNTDGSLKASTSFLGLEADIFSFSNLSAKINGNSFKTDKGIIPYNQMIVVKVTGSFNFLDQQFRQGDILVMPMIQAFAMSNSNRNIVAENSAWLAIDVASLFIGVGEVKVLFTAGNYVRKAIILSDIIGSSTGAIATGLNNDAISPDMRSKIQLLSIVASTPQLLKSFKKVDNLITELDGLYEIKGAEQAWSYYYKIRQVVRVTGKFDDIIEKYPALKAFYNSLNSNSLKDAFKLDIGAKADDILLDLNKTENADILEAWKTYRINHINGIICN